MGLPILAADLSQMPKYGVIARSPLAQIFPSQGRRRRTSSDVRLVLQLKDIISVYVYISLVYTYPVVMEQSLRNPLVT